MLGHFTDSSLVELFWVPPPRRKRGRSLTALVPAKTLHCALRLPHPARPARPPGTVCHLNRGRRPDYSGLGDETRIRQPDGWIPLPLRVSPVSHGVDELRSVERNVVGGRPAERTAAGHGARRRPPVPRMEQRGRAHRLNV